MVRPGLVWAYAFNHEEALACFERALAADPNLWVARWGIAYVVGPNYNKGWDAFDPVDLGEPRPRPTASSPVREGRGARGGASGRRSATWSGR